MFDNIRLLPEDELKKMIIGHRIMKYAMFIVFVALFTVFINTQLSFWGILCILSLVMSQAQATSEAILSSRMELRLQKGEQK